MLQEQGVDISPTVKPGVKPDNFSELVKESKDKSTKKYKKSIKGLSKSIKQLIFMILSVQDQRGPESYDFGPSGP